MFETHYFTNSKEHTKKSSNCNMKKLWSILVDNKDLFPTKWSFCIFVTYMALFTCQGILVTASRLGDNTYPYNTTTVVLLTEVTKLIFATLAYISRYNIVINRHSRL